MLTRDMPGAMSIGGSSSYTTSLASSVYTYSYENGRRYHAYREGSKCT